MSRDAGARPAVTVRILGGLGNQLFQYAAARSLALDLGLDLELHLEEFRHYRLRACLLDRFRIAGRPADPERVRAQWRSVHGRLAWLRRRLPGTPQVAASGRDLPRLRPGRGVWMEGFWQSESHFLNHASEVRDELVPKDPPTGPAARLLARIDPSASVSVHVRRGDYVSDPGANRVHGLVTADYYRRALDLVLQDQAAAKVWVFSDDPAWVQAELDLGRPFECVDLGLDGRPEEDLRCMTACRHHVLANSTFSWWGAWLSGERGRVVAPARWFADAAQGLENPAPPRWRRL